tara:strand:+ start:63348 stop:64088 length:741 start_codon:yes stop_codon:yes gene_type:complete
MGDSNIKYLSGFAPHFNDGSVYLENGFYRKVNGVHANFLYESGPASAGGYDMMFDTVRGIDATDPAFSAGSWADNYGNIGIIQFTKYMPSSLEFGRGDYSDREGQVFYIYMPDSPRPHPVISPGAFYGTMDEVDAGSLLYGSTVDYDDMEKYQLSKKFRGLYWDGEPYDTSFGSELESTINAKINKLSVEVSLTMITRANIPNVINIEKDVTSLDTFADETAASATTVGIETTATTTVSSTSTSGY